MKKVKLGSSDLMVSEICLGTMTWGVQNSQEEANEQIDYALEHGVNFMDTAEMYPTPPSADGYGVTEQIIGRWLASNQQRRSDFVLMTKIAGNGLPWVRDGGDITGKAIIDSIDASLKRLQTDYIDVYQLHWPNRTSPHFAKHWPGKVDPTAIDVQKERDGILDMLRAIDESITAGKIRHIGLSDDTPWGINEFLRLAEQNHLPKIVSIQNEFNLIHLKDSPYLIENCVLNDVAYLPWSPIAGGALSGKYRNGARPENSRWSFMQRNGIFRDTTTTHEAIEAYYEVAKKHNLPLVEMALKWVYQFKGVTSTIIGATSRENLKQNINAYHLELSEEVMSDINTVIRKYPMPF